MRAKRSAALFVGFVFLYCKGSFSPAEAAGPQSAPLPRVAEGWRIELVAQAPEILFPTAIVVAPDGTIYLGQDPMDMPGPPTSPIDSVVAIKNGKVKVFADKLWAVMGLEWVEDTLYVVHAPFLSAFRDTNGDGRADERIDLVTGLGPKLPGFNGINDHVASGIRLGMDGFLYISVGDKGIPKAVGKDGATIQLYGGGVIRVRPDGTGLEVVSTGERNPLSVMLSATDEVFTYGNDDDSKKWPNSLTHHTVGAHFGYPYQFLTAPWRALPIMSGQIGGSGTQGICYNEDGLPKAYRGNLLFCDWGLQTVFRVTIERAGGTFRVKTKTPLVTRGECDDFRPFSLAVSSDGAALYLVDWAFTGWLADGPKTGRLYRLSHTGANHAAPAPRPSSDDAEIRVGALDHAALAVRLESQRRLSRLGAMGTEILSARLRQPAPETGRLHALWALDAINSAESRGAIRKALGDASADVRLQAARSAGIRRDRLALMGLQALLRDRDAGIRREAAIALGRLGDASAGPALMAALGDTDRFVAWSVRRAIRQLGDWNAAALTAALVDPKRRDDALALCDETWEPPVVEALVTALGRTTEPGARARIVAALAGLYRKYPAWTGRWFGTNPLAGQLPQKTEAWDTAAMARVQAGLAVALRDASPEVRLQAIAGLFIVGHPAAAVLRAALTTETEPRNLAAIAQGLGVLGDFPSAPALGAILADATKPELVRASALDALGTLRGPQALTARLSLVYDPKAPASLLARALPSLGRQGIIPPNDLVSFLDHADPAIRAASLRALTARKTLPNEVRQAVLARLGDAVPEVKRAAAEAAAALDLREAVPGLVKYALKDPANTEAFLALAAMSDPRALEVYLEALRDRNPEVRRAAESALVRIRDSVKPQLEQAARSGRFDGQSIAILEHVLTEFRPVTEWKVIGPFPRTTAVLFVSEPSIDFSRKHTGAEGRVVAWTPRRGERGSGRVIVDDFKEGAGDRGGFGYDTSGSPDLSCFGFAEVESDRDREAFMHIGSSGTVLVTVNEQVVFRYDNLTGREYDPVADTAKIALKKGKNRILVVSRQGIGAWSFGIQVSERSAYALAGRAPAAGLERYRAFALTHEGDPRSGEAIFFDEKGIGCGKCHAAAGRGTADIGPDLTGLALKYDKAEIIRSVLEPSNRIATGYQPVSLATRDGKVSTRVIRSETDAYLEVAGSDARISRIAKDTIEARRAGDLSIMPAGLHDPLSLVEFADLISYLRTLKSAPSVPAVSARVGDSARPQTRRGASR
jgi:putative heme-binding domain-containing protein